MINLLFYHFYKMSNKSYSKACDGVKTSEGKLNEGQTSEGKSTESKINEGKSESSNYVSKKTNRNKNVKK